MADPLTQLTKIDVPFQSVEDQQIAFARMTTVFKTPPILRHFDQQWEVTTEPDMSDDESAAVLSPKDDHRILRPVAYFSKTPTPAECNHHIYDKELMAINRALEK